MAVDYDTWKMTPDNESTWMDDYIEDKMIANSNLITDEMEESLKDKRFPMQELALVIYSAMQENITGAAKLAKRLGIDALEILDIYALTDDFEKYSEMLRNQ